MNNNTALSSEFSAPRISRLSAVLVVACVALTACGGGKKINTVDGSVDYQSAQSLPPLKKPSKASAASRTAPAAVVEDIADSAPEVEINETVVDANEQASTSIPAAEPAAQISAPEIVADVPAEPEPSDEEQQPASSVNARVIAPKANVSRLQVETDFDEAWRYLANSLKRSDVTVFSRNKKAGRFAIGCNGIDDAPTAARKGGWSFMNKKKQRDQEYCALQAVATRGSTVVTVLNRANQEVDGDSSGKIFARILNN